VTVPDDDAIEAIRARWRDAATLTDALLGAENDVAALLVALDAAREWGGECRDRAIAMLDLATQYETERAEARADAERDHVAACNLLRLRTRELERERERAEAAEHERDTARRAAIEEAIGVDIAVPPASPREPHPGGFRRGVLAYRDALRALLPTLPRGAA
jgi:hypothetical protein